MAEIVLEVYSKMRGYVIKLGEFPKKMQYIL